MPPSLRRPEAKRVTPTDIAMVEKAEELLGCGSEDREEVFLKVQEEKRRIGHLTAGQLLRRDLKVGLAALILILAGRWPQGLTPRSEWPWPPSLSSARSSSTCRTGQTM